LHYIDLFPEWPRGILRLAGMLRREAQRRRRVFARGRGEAAEALAGTFCKA